MKMSLLVSVWILAGVFRGHGQGIVNFNNTPTLFANDGVDRFVYDLDGVTSLTGTNWAAALYFGTSESSITTLAVSRVNPTLEGSRALFRAPPTTLPGTWRGGTRVLIGTVNGQDVWMQVRVWDNCKFADYATASSAGGIIGQSAPFQFHIREPVTPGPSDNQMYNLRSFSIVPEPRLFPLLLGALGGLLGFRCRSRWFG